MTSTNNNSNNVALVIGVGPGIGSAVAHKFASEGFKIGLISRTQDKLDTVSQSISKLYSNAIISSATADAGNEQSLRQGIQHIVKKLGNITVLMYNAGGYVRGGVLDVRPSELTNALNVGTVGLLTACQEVLPHMLQHKRGTILVTGATASLRGGAKFLGLSTPKGGTRNLTQSIAREVQPQGIHVAHIIIDGQVSTPQQVKNQPERSIDSFLSHTEIANQYYNLYKQHHTTWTFEIDLRPYVEKW